MSTPFQNPRPIFAVLDRRMGWGAFLAARITAGDPGQTANREPDIRHLDDLEALDSCLVDSRMPVGILVADDFADLSQLVAFVARHAGRPDTRLVVAARQGHPDTEWLLREAGAHQVVRNMEQVLAMAGPMRSFFQAYY